MLSKSDEVSFSKFYQLPINTEINAREHTIWERWSYNIQNRTFDIYKSFDYQRNYFFIGGQSHNYMDHK